MELREGLSKLPRGHTRDIDATFIQTWLYKIAFGITREKILLFSEWPPETARHRTRGPDVGGFRPGF